jgi:hypothetical protein
MEGFTPPIKINIDTWEDVKILGPSVMAQMGDVISNVNPVISIARTVLFFFKILFVLIFGVPVALSLCIAYLFVYTFFGIAILKPSAKGEDISEYLEGIMTIIREKIPEYARSEKDKIKEETFCDPLTIFEKIVNYFHAMFDVMYKYCFELGFIYMLIFGIFDCWYNLKLRNVKITMFSITFFFLTCILGRIYYRVNKEYQTEAKEKASATTETLPPSTK